MMRIATLLLLLLPYFLFAQINQTDQNGLRQGFWQKKQDNGRLLYEGNYDDGKPVGEWKRFHPNSQVKAILRYQSGTDSVFAELFDMRGQKVAEGTYIDQNKAGRWTYLADKHKVADEEYVQGKKHGLSRKFYKTGEVQESIQWENGLKHGDYQVFFTSGKPFVQCKMNHDQRHGLYLTYFDNGNLELEAEYSRGLRHGDWKYYDRNGQLQYTLKYQHGKILNSEVRDSIANQQLQLFEQGGEQLPDPEKYLDDPAEYLRKMNGFK